jgi:energy-converting hydrogenase Eha subunit C
MSSRVIFWGEGEGGRCLGLTALFPSRADYLEILGASINLLEPIGTLLTCLGIGIGSIIDKRRVDGVKTGTVSN